MELTKRQRTIKYLCYCAMILLADLLQNTSGLFPEIAGARCFLLIPLTIFIASNEDFLIASLMGLFAGLLWDLHSPVHLGFNCIVLTVFCFVCSVLVTHIARNIFTTNMILSSLASFAYILLYWLAFIIIKGIHGGSDTLFYFYIPSAVYTIIASMPMWLITRAVTKRLNKANE